MDRNQYRKARALTRANGLPYAQRWLPADQAEVFVKLARAPFDWLDQRARWSRRDYDTKANVVRMTTPMHILEAVRGA